MTLTEHNKRTVKRLYSLYILEAENFHFKRILEAYYPVANKTEINEMYSLVIKDVDSEALKKSSLRVLFRDIPQSPVRVNWRPSLANLHSPNTLVRGFRRHGF
jgi:hypothetical protein